MQNMYGYLLAQCQSRQIISHAYMANSEIINYFHPALTIIGHIN
jgi:hypothetical protein